MVTSTEQIVMNLNKNLLSQEQAKSNETVAKPSVSLAKLSAALQKSLEIQPILDTFSHHLAQVLDHSGFTYENIETGNLIKSGIRSHHSCSYSLSIETISLGEISLMRRYRFSESDLAHIETALSVLLYPLKNALLYQSALKAALTDSLTGALNRSTLNNTFEQEIARAKRLKSDLSMLMLDIDYFKRVNDTFGHAAGDQALIAVTNCIKQTVREIDPIFRVGGEEFIVILSGSHAEGAKLLAERLRCAIESLLIEHADGTEPFSISASIGIASYHKGDQAGDMMQRSDQALYIAKKEGRNRVISSS